MAVTISTPEDEITYQELTKLLKKRADKGISAERLLAIAANMVGKLCALQDQRTMTHERAMAIVAQNIQNGNQQLIDRLMNNTAGHS